MAGYIYKISVWLAERLRRFAKVFCWHGARTNFRNLPCSLTESTDFSGICKMPQAQNKHSLYCSYRTSTLTASAVFERSNRPGQSPGRIPAFRAGSGPSRAGNVFCGGLKPDKHPPNPSGSLGGLISSFLRLFFCAKKKIWLHCQHPFPKAVAGPCPDP